jgi:signal peptidase I
LHWKSVASLALQVAVLAALVAAFFIRMPEVSGLSMEPRIASGEFVLINTVAYRFGPPIRGDVVAFRHDTDRPVVYIKRVIGVPGDRVRVEAGAVYVNDRRLAESYVRFPDNRSFSKVTVPPRSLYVLGDNRVDSDDSRFWGFVSYDQVLGRAVAGIWPIGRAGAL